MDKAKKAVKSSALKVMEFSANSALVLTNTAKSMKGWAGTINHYGNFFINVGSVELDPQDGEIPVVLHRGATISCGIGCTILRVGEVLSSSSDALRRIGVACTAIGLFNDTPGLLSLIDGVEQPQPKRVMLHSIQDPRDLLMEWKKDRVMLSIESTDDLSLHQAVEVFDKFKNAGLEHFLVGDKFKRKKRENDLVMAAKMMESLPADASVAIEGYLAQANQRQPNKVLLFTPQDETETIATWSDDPTKLSVEVSDAFTLDQVGVVFEQFKALGIEKYLVGEKFNKKMLENELLPAVRKLDSLTAETKKAIEDALGCGQVQPQS